MTDVVIARGLRKSFASKHVLRGVELTLRRGEIVGFVGPNGAGKSTCLRVLLGLIHRDAGDVRVLDRDPEREGPTLRAHCSYLTGETSLYQHMRGREFLDFALSFYPQQDHARRQRMQEFFGLPLEHKVRHYSAGMKQQLALLACLTPDVDLYVLDEPDRALDATTRLFLRDVLRALHDRGKTLLLSSHHLSELEALAGRLVFLLDGRCVEEDRVEAARNRLRRRVRLRLRPGAALPHDTVAEPDADGSWSIVPDEEPLRWLARFAPADIESAQIGVVRLEELYQALTIEAGAS